MHGQNRLVAICLAGVAISLLLVGIVSGTVVRHIIQVIPVVVALAVVARETPWALNAARPIFLFWFVIMLLIWLFLLGIARIVTGKFTPAEIALTIVIGSCCVVGGVATLSSRGNAGRLPATLTFLVFAALQILAVWVSTLPQFAHD